MKQLTKEEFQDRVEAIQRARKIFIGSNLTNDITIAFELYQEVFADRERELTIKKTQTPTGMGISPLDDYERPKCPTCEKEMSLRLLPENEEGFKTQWICPTETCDNLNSENDVNWWLNNLKKKEK